MGHGRINMSRKLLMLVLLCICTSCRMTPKQTRQYVALVVANSVVFQLEIMEHDRMVRKQAVTHTTQIQQSPPRPTPTSQKHWQELHKNFGGYR